MLKELILDVPGGVGVQWGLDLAGTILTEWGFSVHEMEVLLEVGISENHCWIFDLATTLDRVAEIINIDSIFHQAGDNFPDLQKSCISLVKKGRSDLGYSQAQWIGESIWELKELL